MKKIFLSSLIIAFAFIGCSNKDLSAECKAEAEELQLRVQKGDTTVLKDLENWSKKCPKESKKIPLGDLTPNPSDDGNFLFDAK